jgi:hypothetical protein
MNVEKPFGLTGQPEVPTQVAERNYDQSLPVGWNRQRGAVGMRRPFLD